MPGIRPLATLLICFTLLTGLAHADLRITLPKRTKATPVQKLNRDGVKAVERHRLTRAKQLFYRAYLLDPNDPFTLNNLGYVAELEGEIERAQRYYALAADLNSEAVVDQASTPAVEGRPVTEVAGAAEERGMQLNRMNVQAIGLLQRHRSTEADLLLQRALQLDPANAFTLNNLGYAREMQGEMEEALGFYLRAAATGSREEISVSANSRWRGRPISDIAEANARQLRRHMRRRMTIIDQVAGLNLRGVSALNRNERRKAREYFEEAYRLNPRDAFTLNNMGYLAEMDGDRETASFYYDSAQEAFRSHERVTVATRRQMEGQPVGQVAAHSTSEVEIRMQAELQDLRRRAGPILLLQRDGTPVTERLTPVQEEEEEEQLPREDLDVTEHPELLLQPVPERGPPDPR